MPARQSITEIAAASSLFELLKKHALSEARIFILADSNTIEHCLPLIMEGLPGEGRNAILLNVGAGEQSKSLAMAEQLYDRLMAYRADRHSLLLNVGGGMICDLGGYVASTYKRGMRWMHLPTTVLAQVDAAIGGKTGVNHRGYKNMVGTFAFPLETVIYPEFLNTLPKREVMSGFAEMMKHALIGSPALWKKMCKAPYIDLPFIKLQIGPALKVKTSIVARDFKEAGERKKLNYGHTIGHALESYMMESPDRDMLHGEAVALGMVAEAQIAVQMGLLPSEELDAISSMVAEHYPQLHLHESQYHRLIELMRQDKKMEGERLNMTLLKGIGQAEIDCNPTMEMVIDSLLYLNSLSAEA